MTIGLRARAPAVPGSSAGCSLRGEQGCRGEEQQHKMVRLQR